MKKLIYIGILALLCGSCASQAPLDDAYYWPDKKAATQTAASLESSSSASQDKRPESSTPPMEVINRQDTTITIRIKR